MKIELQEVTMELICRKSSSGHRTRLSKRRLMRSTGHNIVSVGIEDKYWKYLSDIYTTLIDIKWRWNILIFVSGFVATWLFFACLYYLFGYVHGDHNKQGPNFIPCIQNVKTFTGAYLFSIETMMTIGYGSRVQTEACPGLFLTVMLQSIVGAGLQFMLASIVVSKTRRAKRRSETILFSNQVCIYEQDSKLHLAIRVGDMRKSEIVGAHAQGYLIKKCKSKDGTYVPIRSYNLDLKGESFRDEIFFPWPTQVLHQVDENSPLWFLSREELLKGDYELIVVIDGVSGATSRPFQARKSYHTWEMKWGHRFADLELTFDNGGSYFMNLSNFHKTVVNAAPLCSARDITHLREMYQANHQQTSHNQHTSSNQTIRGSNSSITINSGNPEIKVTCDGNDTSSQTSLKMALRNLRSISMQEKTEPKDNQNNQRQRRCSLGDIIRVARGPYGASNTSYTDALNIYRHRRSVTDTYLGEEIKEESDETYDSSQAILSVVSQRSAEKRIDYRDTPKRRRSSVHLYFGKETGASGDEDTEYDTAHSLLSVGSHKDKDRRPDVREVFARRKSSVQLLFGQESRDVGTESLLEEQEKLP